MRISYGKNKKLEELEIQILVRCDDNIWVAYMPDLDLSTHGESQEDAIRAAGEAARIFLEDLMEMGTVNEVLPALGWQPAPPRSAFPYVPPHIIQKSQQIKIQCPV